MRLLIEFVRQAIICCTLIEQFCGCRLFVFIWILWFLQCEIQKASNTLCALIDECMWEKVTLSPGDKGNHNFYSSNLQFNHNSLQWSKSIHLFFCKDLYTSSIRLGSHGVKRNCVCVCLKRKCVCLNIVYLSPWLFIWLFVCFFDWSYPRFTSNSRLVSSWG